jgi:UDP-N-acetyl-alpha-D-muramoyl-L-alanyl-L-glutamate epimerase
VTSVFRYQSYAIDAESGLLTCTYSLDGRQFSERVTVQAGQDGPARWTSPAARAAARLVFLLAGVSYYKTAAPPVIDLGDLALTPLERDFLRDFYVSGLAEFAYRNGLELNPSVNGPSVSVPLAPSARSSEADGAIGTLGLGRGLGLGGGRALVPFGGGIDSIVTVEAVRRRAEDVALFVVSRPGDTYDAIERPAAVTGLPIRRATREIDPQLLRSAENGFLNGHVPVTGIISAIAVLAAVLDGRDEVVMSNEWSASIPTLEYQGRPVNHQYSKSAEFEEAFRAVLAQYGLPGYFSYLRDRTELWVGREFAALDKYHGSFRSCNKAFYADKNRRLDDWCGQCDKCCFIDLILAPFLARERLSEIFAVAGEPLADAGLRDKFRALLGAGAKPFECVGEVNECRAATLLAARRPDRAGDPLLQQLAADVSQWPDAPSPDDAEAMLRPVGESFVPGEYR